MTGATATRTVTGSVSGGTGLQLVITNCADNINDDHGDSDAKLTCSP